VCRAEFPRLQQILDKYKAQNFHIVTINLIAEQEVGALKIMSNYGFTSLKNPGGDFSWSRKAYGVQSTPTSFLLDPEGKIVFNIPGLESLDDEKTADQEVAGLLKWTASTAASAHPAATPVKAQP